jgi:hypothetical protein
VGAFDHHKYQRHQAIGRHLLSSFPDLDPALGWRIADWIVLGLPDVQAAEWEDLMREIRDVAYGGIEFDDARLDYVTVQLSRVTLTALRALVTEAPRGA